MLAKLTRIRIQPSRSARWNLQHFSFSFLFFSELSVRISTRLENGRTVVECHCPYPIQGNALRWRGVWRSTFQRHSHWADGHGRLPSASRMAFFSFFFFFWKETSPADTDWSLNLEPQNKNNKIKTRKWSSDHLPPLWPSDSLRTELPRSLSRTLRVCRLTAVVYEYTSRLSSRHFFTAVKFIRKVRR